MRKIVGMYNSSVIYSLKEYHFLFAVIKFSSLQLSQLRKLVPKDMQFQAKNVNGIIVSKTNRELESVPTQVDFGG